MSGLLPYSKARGSKSGCDRPQRRGEATWDSRQSAFFVYRPSYRIGFSFLPPKLEKKGANPFATRKEELLILPEIPLIPRSLIQSNIGDESLSPPFLFLASLLVRDESPSFFLVNFPPDTRLTYPAQHSWKTIESRVRRRIGHSIL